MNIIPKGNRRNYAKGGRVKHVALNFDYPEEVRDKMRQGPDVFDPDYQKGIIREIDPPDWMDPHMEFTPTERGNRGFTPEGEMIPAPPARLLEESPDEREA
jgi:hypothetical protein